VQRDTFEYHADELYWSRIHASRLHQDRWRAHDCVMADTTVSGLLDAHAIRSLVERYALAVDAGNTSDFLSVFTSDAHLAYIDGTSITHFHGADELAQIPPPPDGGSPRTMHFIGNHLAVINGDAAHGTTYCRGYYLQLDRSVVVLMVRYADRYIRRADGTWLIDDRVVTVEWTETAQALPATL
jgi:SnoaL-like protein